jgi:hypothetical protein
MQHNASTNCATAFPKQMKAVTKNEGSHHHHHHHVHEGLGVFPVP